MKSKSYFRPRMACIEYLESRIAPANFIVTNLNDAGAGSLRQAVLDANAKPGLDAIIFRGAAANGEIALTSGEIDITDSVNIVGPGAGRLIIDAQDLSRIFDIDDGTAAVKSVTISGLSMVEGNSGTGNVGGGIRSRESLTVNNSVISGCSASADGGGAIYIATSGKLTIRNSKLTGNSSSGPGGAITAAPAGGAQIISTLIAGNSSAGNGGGVLFSLDSQDSGDILIDRSSIIDNSGLNGGGIWVENDRRGPGGQVLGKITIRNTNVSGNIASESGGGVYLSSGLVLLDRDIIANNTAAVAGGGVHGKNHDSLTVRSCQVLNNHTIGPESQGGGGISNEGSLDVLIQRTLIAGNTAGSGNGGGIRASFSELIIQASTLTSNSADNGGGVHTSNSVVSVFNSSIRENQALNAGGGISTASLAGNTLRIVNSLFSGNDAGDSGGGVDTSGDGRVEIFTSRFIGNVASSSGGGLYLRSGTGVISIFSSLIAQNSAREDGGGLALKGPAGITITNTRIINNLAAGDDGGGIALFGGTLTLRNSLISGNVAADSGGGTWTQDTVPPVFINTRVVDNTAPTGPQNAAAI